MDEDFIRKAEIKRNEYLLKTEKLFMANYSKWLADFTEHFRDVCVKIRKEQDNSSLSTITNLKRQLYQCLWTGGRAK